MKLHRIICAILAASLFPPIAQADDPNDPTMRNPAVRARDREITRKLNRQEFAKVRQRDAHIYAAYDKESTARSRDHDNAMTAYNRDRQQYERDMAAWRRSVAACRAGDYSACDN